MKATICTISAGILWGIISIFLKPLYKEGFSSLQIMLGRSLISSIILFFFILIKNPALLKIKLKDIWIFICSGVLSLTFFSVCYFTTIKESGASVAVVLLYISPIFVVLMSRIFFKEKLTCQKIIALILMFCGCFFVAGLIGNGSRMSLKGFVVGISAGFGYALYSIFSKIGLRKYASETITFYTFCFSAISILPFCHVEQIFSLVNLKNSIFFVGISLFSTVLPYALYTYGLTKIETGKASILATIEPVVGCLIGIFLWKEEVSVFKIIGMIIIIASIILLELPPIKSFRKKN